MFNGAPTPSNPKTPVYVSDAAGGDLTGTYPNPTLKTGIVTADKIATGTITANEIANNTITSAKLANGSVSGSIIIANSILKGHLGNDIISGNIIKIGTVLQGHVDDGYVDLLNHQVVSGIKLFNRTPRTSYYPLVSIDLTNKYYVDNAIASGSGGSGTISGAGTIGKLLKFTASDTAGDSVLSESAGNIIVANGSQIQGSAVISGSTIAADSILFGHLNPSIKNTFSGINNLAINNQSNINVLNSSISGTTNVLTNTQSRVTVLESNTSGIYSLAQTNQTQINVLNNNTSGINNLAINNQGRINTLSNNQSGIYTLAQTNQNNINIITSSISGTTTILTNTQSRVTVLESNTSGIYSLAQTNQSNLNIVINNLSGTTTLSRDNQSRITTLDFNTSGIYSLAQTNQSNINVLNSSISGTTNVLTNTQSRVTVLESNQSGIYTLAQTNQTQINVLNNNFSGTTNVLTDTQSRTTVLTSNFSGLTNTVNNNQLRTTTLEFNTSGINNNLIDTQNRVTVLEGSAATISGSGTAGRLSKFIDINTIGNSVLSENAGKVTTDGNLIFNAGTMIEGACVVSGSVICANSILNGHIGNNEISTAKLQIPSVSGSVIATPGIGTGHLADNTVTNSKILASSISGNAIQSQGILLGHLNPEITNTFSGINSLSISNQSNINVLNSSISGTTNVLTNTQSRVTVLTSNFSGLTNTVDSNQSRITILENAPGGTGTISGLGQATYLTKFSANDTVVRSNFIEDSGKLLIGISGLPVLDFSRTYPAPLQVYDPRYNYGQMLLVANSGTPTGASIAGWYLQVNPVDKSLNLQSIVLTASGGEPGGPNLGINYLNPPEKLTFDGRICMGENTNAPSALAGSMKIWAKDTDEKLYLTTVNSGTRWVSTNDLQIFKYTNESTNTDTTLSNDSALQFSIAANEVWRFKFVLFYDTGGSSTPDFSISLNGPGTPRVLNSQATIFDNNGSAAAWSKITTYGTRVDVVLSAAQDSYCLIEGTVFNGTTAGTLAAQWAQRSSSAVNVTVQAGSYCVATKIRG